MSPRTPPELPHPDDVTGALSGVLTLLAAPTRNTLADVAVYRGLPPEVLFPAPGSTPEARVTTRWRMPGMVSEDIVFPSLHEPIEPGFRERYVGEYAEIRTVYARRIRPASARERPRLVYLHGYLQPETYVEELALLVSMARLLDVEVVQLQPPYHGRRTPRAARFGGELYWTADLVRSIEALRQSLLDARTLLRWLHADDARPAGIMGLSLGGALTLALTCLEHGFAFSIPLIAHMDLAAMVADAPVLRRMRHELRLFGWGIDEFRRFVEDLGWYALAPRLAPDRIAMFAASDDHFFDPAIVEETWRSWGRPAIRWYPGSHMGFLTRLPDVMAEARRFIDACAARPGAGGAAT
jgi:pimeloyl-ACP methyl ester carboxylesterase